MLHDLRRVSDRPDLSGIDLTVSLDPVQITQMAKHLETVYVSGWQCSSTASSSLEPGPDLAGA